MKPEINAKTPGRKDAESREGRAPRVPISFAPFALCAFAFLLGCSAEPRPRQWQPYETWAAHTLATATDRWDYVGQWRDLIITRQPSAFSCLGAYRNGELIFTLSWEQFEAMYPLKYECRCHNVAEPDYWDESSHQDHNEYPKEAWFTANGIIEK